MLSASASTTSGLPRAQRTLAPRSRAHGAAAESRADGDHVGASRAPRSAPPRRRSGRQISSGRPAAIAAHVLRRRGHGDQARAHAQAGLAGQARRRPAFPRRRRRCSTRPKSPLCEERARRGSACWIAGVQRCARRRARAARLPRPERSRDRRRTPCRRIPGHRRGTGPSSSPRRSRCNPRAPPRRAARRCRCRGRTVHPTASTGRPELLMSRMTRAASSRAGPAQSGAEQGVDDHFALRQPLPAHRARTAAPLARRSS